MMGDHVTRTQKFGYVLAEIGLILLLNFLYLIKNICRKKPKKRDEDGPLTEVDATTSIPVGRTIEFDSLLSGQTRSDQPIHLDNVTISAEYIATSTLLHQSLPEDVTISAENIATSTRYNQMATTEKPTPRPIRRAHHEASFDTTC